MRRFSLSPVRGMASTSRAATDEAIARLKSVLKNGPYEMDVYRLRTQGKRDIEQGEAKIQESEKILNEAADTSCDTKLEEAEKVRQEGVKMIDEGNKKITKATEYDDLIKKARHYASTGELI
ncbi:unnamed protein product [Arabis nemorensis]|uniref:Uncharacterized protein n=1 Tax=Arabis nemorensis TaxID=586526 RepID=A0A565CQP7_9BRAS|nr:unnamed protein product [Arabis nemorensis]